MSSQPIDLRIQVLRATLASLNTTKNVQHMMCMSYAKERNNAALQQGLNSQNECWAKMNSYGAEYARTLLMWMEMKAQIDKLIAERDQAIEREAREARKREAAEARVMESPNDADDEATGSEDGGEVEEDGRNGGEDGS